MRALLDVNVLIALFDSDHIFHRRANEWWLAQSKEGWASCPITENGLVRIMSNPNYSKTSHYAPTDLIGRLRETVQRTNHEFWPDELSLRDADSFNGGRLLSSKLITDHYLLALAVKRSGRLATFDGAIPLSAVRLARPANISVV